MDFVHKLFEDLQGAWRYRWVAIAVAWAVAIIGWTIVFLMPDRYQAGARVYVDTTTPLKPLLQGLTPESDVNAQLNLVRQALLSRPQLEKVARETDLDLRAVTPAQKEALIERLQQDIRIDVAGQKGANRGNSDSLYTITYEDVRRDKALDVVQTLLNTFMENTLGGKRSGAESAEKFIEEQIREYEKRLTEAEQKLADFKRENMGLMPSQSGDYFQRVQQEEEALSAARAQYRIAVSRRDAIARQIKGETPYLTGGSTAGAGAMPGAQHDVDSRIQETQARLDELLLRYTDKHPEVVATRATLEELKRRRDADLQAIARGEPGSGLANLDSNPVFQSMQVSLSQAEVEVAGLQGEINDRERRIAQLKSRLDVAPDVEAELARLNRDYDVTRSQYQALVQRRESARLSGEADETGIVRFDVIDPPVAKLEPVAPDRLRLVPAVFIAALIAGVGVAWGLYMLRPAFTSTRALAEITGLPVLGAISLTWVERQKLKLRKQNLVLAGAAGLLVIAFAVTMLVETGGSAWLRSATTNLG